MYCCLLIVFHYGSHMVYNLHWGEFWLSWIWFPPLKIGHVLSIPLFRNLTRWVTLETYFTCWRAACGIFVLRVHSFCYHAAVHYDLEHIWTWNYEFGALLLCGVYTVIVNTSHAVLKTFFVFNVLYGNMSIFKSAWWVPYVTLCTNTKNLVHMGLPGFFCPTLSTNIKLLRDLSSFLITCSGGALLH
jgi:hypothetical protein